MKVSYFPGQGQREPDIEFYILPGSVSVGPHNHFFDQHNLPQVIMTMFNNPVNIPVIRAVFFIGKYFPELFSW